MNTSEEAETPADILSNIRSTISCLQRLESTIVKQEEKEQKQPVLVNSTSTQTETEILAAKPDVSYFRQSKMMAQYRELAGVGGVLRQVVSEVVSSEEVKTLGALSTSNQTGPSSSPSSSPLPPSRPSSTPKLAQPRAATSPISPAPVCATSKASFELTSQPTVISSTACSPLKSSSDSQISVPQFLIYTSRSLSQSTNVTSFESTDSGLAGGSFEADSPEPPLTIDLEPQVAASSPKAQQHFQSQSPSAEMLSKNESIRQSMQQQLVTTSVGLTSSTIKQTSMTDSEVARLLQSTSTTFSSSQTKRRGSAIEEQAEHYKRPRTNTASLEQLRMLQHQRNSLVAEVAARGAVQGVPICGSAHSQQSLFTWPQVPLPQGATQSLVDSVRKGQFRRQESIGDLKHSTWVTSSAQPPPPSVGNESLPKACRQANCRACGPAFMEQQLQWQRSARSNSLPVQGQTLVEPTLNLFRRASAPVSIAAGALRQPTVPATSTGSAQRRGSSQQLLAGLTLTAAQSGQLHQHQQVQQAGGLQSHTIYYNSHQHQGLPSSMSMAALAPTSATFTQSSSVIGINRPHSTSLLHQHQIRHSPPTSSQHQLSRTSPTSAQTGPGGAGCLGPLSSCSLARASQSSSLPMACIVTGCTQLLANQVALADHLQVKHSAGLYWCCGSSYTMSSFLQEHIHTRHRSDPICQLCGRLFQQAKALWEHLSSYQCEQMIGAGGEQQNAGTARYVKCTWIGCNWTGIDQARHHQRVHLRLINKYTRPDGPLGGDGPPNSSAM